MGGSDNIGCCGCRVIMAGDRRADTPSIENLVGKGVGGEREGVVRMVGCPGVKEAGCFEGRSMGGRGVSNPSDKTFKELASKASTLDASWGVVYALW